MTCQYIVFSPSGLIVGGLDRGFISVYDASRLLKGNGENALMFTKDKHTGQVGLLMTAQRGRPMLMKT